MRRRILGKVGTSRRDVRSALGGCFSTVFRQVFLSRSVQSLRADGIGQVYVEDGIE